ncbi:MAG: hypothetical protein DRQ51_10440 [Gammaproteobacteria bacterium]|nr:MAG: hypothetical protein DRQ51_10440 [Gammaproteobacteria bacterium]
MTNVLKIFVIALFLFSCVANPPIQQMSDARQAIKATQKEIIKSQVDRQDKSYKLLSQAQQILKQAKKSLDDEDYEMAEKLAMDAKKMAQLSLQQLKQFLAPPE